jgi:hypothetical protein
MHIHAVETRGVQPAGKTCIIPEFGGLVGTASTEIHDGRVNFEKVPDFINHRQPRGGLGL